MDEERNQEPSNPSSPSAAMEAMEIHEEADLLPERDENQAEGSPSYVPSPETEGRKYSKFEMIECKLLSWIHKMLEE